jgi:hypothetical protein
MVASLKFLLLSSCLLLTLLTGPAAATASPTYYSDYFSFIGQDDHGYLLLALDNNRRSDTHKFEAEHFGVLYAEHQGWIDLVGTGEYPNPLGILSKIPDSVAFQFVGSLQRGIRIQSRINDLRLEINPLGIRLEKAQEERSQLWGNAAAVLYWQGRIIPGRVIYQRSRQTDDKRLSHRYSRNWDNFQGFYLALQIGPPASWQDIYLHAEGAKDPATIGFVDTGRDQVEISAPDLQVNKKGWALGFYRWNKSWQMHLKPTPTPELPDPLTPVLTLKQVSRQNISNWLVGGFAMSVVEGTLEVDGRSCRVLGFAEQIN